MPVNGVPVNVSMYTDDMKRTNSPRLYGSPVWETLNRPCKFNWLVVNIPSPEDKAILLGTIDLIKPLWRPLYLNCFINNSIYMLVPPGYVRRLADLVERKAIEWLSGEMIKWTTSRNKADELRLPYISVWILFNSAANYCLLIYETW